MTAHTTIEDFAPIDPKVYVVSLPPEFMGDEFSYWRRALMGDIPPSSDGDIQTGYYRASRKGRDIDSAITFWRDSHTAEWRCHMDGQEFDIHKARVIWNYCRVNPITHLEYGYRVRNGRFPNDSAVLIGHNAMPPEDTIESILERIDDLAREAERMIAAGEAPNKNVADQASDLSNTFAELEKKADALRVAEKAPHWDACQAVDGKWKPLIEKAATLKRRLKLIVVTPWLNKRREEADRAAALAIASGNTTPADERETITAGSSKRSTALRTQIRGEITDYPAFIAYLIENNNPKLRECAQSLADSFAKAGVEVAGMKINKTKVAA